MTQKRDKISIFLTVLILIIVVAMGVYGFIYRDKILENFQKFTKSPITDRQTINREPIPIEKATVVDSKPIEKETIEKVTEHSEKVENRSSKPVLSEKEKNELLLPNDIDIPSKPLDKTITPKSEFASKLPKDVQIEERHHRTHHKIKHGKKFKKVRIKKSGIGLEKRVTKLERRLGVKKKSSTLARRVYRLEKIISKKKKHK
jgi:hypothetical protein